MALILKSKPIVEENTEILKAKCLELKERGITPSMKVILVGNNPASVVYTRNKKKFCEKIGAECEIVNLDETLSENDFRNAVDKIATDSSVHGCFIQLPLPDQLSHIDVGQLIPPSKDVDGFHAENLYKLLHGSKGEDSLLPCTPKGIITLLNYYDLPIKGQNIVIIGRSLIVGKPLSLLLTNYDATVTVCHSRTTDLQNICKKAEIIVSAIGKKDFVTKDFIGDNQPVVIDVGINLDENKKLCGDVSFDEIKDMCKAITPVPGGVGPLTILSLIQNLLQASEKNI